MSFNRTQRGTLTYVLAGTTVALAGAAVAVSVVRPSTLAGKPFATALAALAGSAALTGAFAMTMSQLTVKDNGAGALVVAFGPVRLFKTAIPFSEIANVAQSRTSLLDGLGIHYSLSGRGWIWNVSGRDCVIVSKKDGSKITVGTDDANGLADFLRTKINAQ